MNKKVFSFSILLLSCFVSNLHAENLELAQISPENLLSIWDYDNKEKAELTDCSITVCLEKYAICIKYLKDDSQVGLSAIWRKSENISDNRLNKLLSFWNMEKIDFAFAVHDDEIIAILSILCVDGGLSEKNFNASMKRLLSDAERFTKFLEDEDAL